MPRVSENIMFNETWRMNHTWKNKLLNKAEKNTWTCGELMGWTSGPPPPTITVSDVCPPTDQRRRRAGQEAAACRSVWWSTEPSDMKQGPISGLVSFVCFCINNIVRTCFRLKAPLCRRHGAEMCFSCRSHWRFFSKRSEISQRWCFPLGGDIRVSGWMMLFCLECLLSTWWKIWRRLRPVCC